jgi:hypothetical protein
MYMTDMDKGCIIYIITVIGGAQISLKKKKNLREPVSLSILL